MKSGMILKLSTVRLRRFVVANHVDELEEDSWKCSSMIGQNHPTGFNSTEGRLVDIKNKSFEKILIQKNNIISLS